MSEIYGYAILIKKKTQSENNFICVDCYFNDNSFYELFASERLLGIDLSVSYLHNEIVNKYNLKITLLDFLQLQKSIPPHWFFAISKTQKKILI